MTDDALKYVKHEIPKNYEHYVLQARARNQALKTAPKSSRDVEIEKLERGFKIYLNGAHSEFGPRKKNKSNSSAPRTAPSKGSKRPNWSKSSKIEIKTERGTYAARAPDTYSEDFEDDDNDGSSDSNSDSSSEQHFALVSLNVNDVKKLRESLVATQSVASDSDSDTPVASDDECMHVGQDQDQPFVIEVTDSVNGEPLKVGAQRRSNAPIQLGTVKRKSAGESLTTNAQQQTKQPVARDSPSSANTLIRPGTQTLPASQRNNLPVIGASANTTENDLDVTVRSTDELENEADQLDSDSNSRLSNLISQIRSLGNRQRSQLLQALDKIEATYGTAQEDTPPNSNRLPDTTSAKPKTQQRAATDGPSQRFVTLEFEICSNYGHPQRVGLTTIQLFDNHGSKLDPAVVDVSRIHKKNVRAETGQLSNLFSARFKTTKEQQMWTCLFDSVSKNTVALRVPLQVPRYSLSRLKIWNYNRPGELNAGAKRIRIRALAAAASDSEGELLYDGDIEMGCGNPVFDYATTIEIAPLSKTSRTQSDLDCDTRPSTRADPEDTPPSSAAPRTANRVSHTQRTASDPDAPPNSEPSTAAPVPSWLQHALAKMEEERSSTRDGREEVSKQQRLASHERDRMLEQSWDSLTHFNQTHAGRLHTGRLDETLADTLKPSGTLLDDALVGLYAVGTKQNESDPALTLSKAFEAVGMDDSSKLCVVGRSTVSSEPRTESPEGDNFDIPELPSGRDLEIDIRTTWGDRYYVGLTGVEAFASDGHPIPIERVSAEPADINVLPEYGNDPRVAQNLVDGVNRTRDDVHMWLAPFTPNAHHYVRLRFAGTFQLALLRIWNYNKSRIHSSRGARLIEIRLDKKLVFRGEITRAHGVLHGGPELFGETILFTTDELVLDRIAQNDPEFLEEVVAAEQSEADTSRPDSAVRFRASSNDEHDTSGARPYTTAHPHALSPKAAAPRRVLNKQAFTSTGCCFELQLLELWQPDAPFFGFNGLELLDDRGDVIYLDPESVAFEWNVVDEFEYPAVDCLLSAETRLRTNDERCTWRLRTPSSPVSPIGSLLVRLPSTSVAQRVCALRIWNANFNDDANVSCSGVKRVRYLLDGRLLSAETGSLLRKAPGHSNLDFAQELRFANSHKYAIPQTLPVTRNGQPVNVGFIYQFVLLCSWDDPYYVGLNGLELFDHEQRKIKLTSKNIAAYPHSVKQLAGNEEDIRTPEKLIDDVNEGLDGRHSWLTVILPNVLNRLWVVFDHPMPVACIRLWNYSKTPQRGVRDFCLYVDDLLVHSGTLPMVNPGARGILPNCSGAQPVYSIMLCDDPNYQNIERNIIKPEDKKTNERSARAPDPNLRPSTCVPQSAPKRVNRPSRQ